MMKDAPRIVDDANGGGDQEPFKLLKKMLANLHQLVPSASEAGLLPGNAVWKAIEDIVSLATSISPEEWEAMKENGNSLMENRSWFAPVYGEFIGKVEVEEAFPFSSSLIKKRPLTLRHSPPGDYLLMIESWISSKTWIFRKPNTLSCWAVGHSQ